MTLLWIAAAFIRWVRLKIYQYEVTFAVYMLTPTEKFIFNSIILTLLSMILTAIYVYLPDHIRTIYGHLYYYWVGERPFSTSIAAISTAFRDSGTQTLEVMYETAQNSAATAAAAVPEL
ncbi:serine palmitoyltransferase small subunit family protein [Aspergillus undulatus]|uniref:serine palmitoyltransferase small subunit family protein n=1 Tax=Aspergillus undulatus TaxID=1810928 RepID=UPI003CCD39EE